MTTLSTSSRPLEFTSSDKFIYIGREFFVVCKLWLQTLWCFLALPFTNEKKRFASLPQLFPAGCFQPCCKMTLETATRVSKSDSQQIGHGSTTGGCAKIETSGIRYLLFDADCSLCTGSEIGMQFKIDKLSEASPNLSPNVSSEMNVMYDPAPGKDLCHSIELQEIV